mmetsp:Transcript_55811/g.103276  ORF Transcript_55811/g.103276 Transcript_55811/m.103276 type:complete len:464 (-) Transcript_55811:35-1426(-)
MALVPAGQSLATVAPETLGAGNENRQYQSVLAVAHSQEQRLVAHAALRKAPGYDLSDPWLVASEVDTDKPSKPHMGKVIPGMPCRVVRSNEVAAYLEADAQPDGTRKVRFASGQVSEVVANRLLELPSRPAQQGEWALPIALPADQVKFLGRRCLCGVAAMKEGKPAFWVNFAPEDPQDPPQMALISSECLVTVAGPALGAALTPWERRMLPNHASSLCQDAIVEFKDHGRLPMLVDERANDLRLAEFHRQGENEQDDASDDAEICIDSGSSSGEEEPPNELILGGLVKGELHDKTVYGYVEQIDEDDVTVKLLEGTNGQDMHEFRREQLAPAWRPELFTQARCYCCGGTEPAQDIILCEYYATVCLGAAHIGCLKMATVPEGSWMCPGCAAGHARSSSGKQMKSRAGQATSKAKAKAKPSSSPSSASTKQAPAVTKAKAKAKAPVSKVKAKAKTKAVPKAKK